MTAPIESHSVPDHKDVGEFLDKLDALQREYGVRLSIQGEGDITLMTTRAQMLGFWSSHFILGKNFIHTL